MARILVENDVRTVSGGQTIERAVSAEGMHPDAFLYLIDGRPVPMDTVLSDEDEVRALRVASGG